MNNIFAEDGKYVLKLIDKELTLQNRNMVRESLDLFD